VVSAIALLYGWPFLRERGLYKGEIAVLMLFAVLGMMLLVSAGSLVMVYLGLELLALCSYALVAIDRDSPLASEAAMKYFVLGALASGMLLYGMSLVYGATGTLDLATIAANAADAEQRTLLLTGMAFMLAGIAFKFGAAPFHMWVPDVYQGAPTPITLFIGSAPKLAAFAHGDAPARTGMARLAEQWRPMLAILAALSLVIGNLVGIAQTNLKRMLAYSTSRTSASCCMGLAGGGAIGYAAAMFYASATRSWRLRRSARSSCCRGGLRSRPHRGLQGPERAQPVDRGPGAVRDGIVGRRAAVPRLLGQARRAARGDRGRDAVAGDRRHRLRGDRCVLLPARDQGDVFRRARRRTGARAAHGSHAARGVRRQRAGAAGARRVLESVHGVVPAGVRLTGIPARQ
jgi:hypothetical protein